jgi:hypothetical protein
MGDTFALISTLTRRDKRAASDWPAVGRQAAQTRRIAANIAKLPELLG